MSASIATPHHVPLSHVTQAVVPKTKRLGHTVENYRLGHTVENYRLLCCNKLIGLQPKLIHIAGKVKETVHIPDTGFPGERNTSLRKC